MSSTAPKPASPKPAQETRRLLRPLLSWNLLKVQTEFIHTGREAQEHVAFVGARPAPAELLLEGRRCQHDFLSGHAQTTSIVTQLARRDHKTHHSMDGKVALNSPQVVGAVADV